MKVFLANLFCFLIAMPCIAQDSLDLSPSGQARYYYATGEIKSEGLMTRGKRNGFWKFYTPGYRLKATETYLNGRLHGPAAHIDTLSGRPLAEGNYKNGDQTGEWKYHFPSGGLKSKVWIDRSLSQGPASYFDSTTGSIKSEGCHVKGRREGAWRFYFNPPTHMYALETYKRGELSGLAQYFDSTTFKLTSEGYHNNNTRNGIWTFYYADGRLKSKETYVNGMLNGHSEFYDSVTARKIEYGQFVDGQRHGKWTMLGEYDSIKGLMTVVYTNGNLDGEFSLQTMGANPGIQSGINRSDGTNGQTTSYYPGTSLTEYIEYTTQQKVDSVVYYDSASQRRTMVLPYQNDKVHGLVKFYYRNGNLQKSVTYKNDVKDGICAEYDSTTGSKICLGYNRDGKSSGRWHSYYINTNKICSEVARENDSMNGPAVYFDSLTSAVIRKGQFRSDKREGVWRDFYASTGKLKSEYGYQSSYCHGNYTAYDSSTGKTILSGLYLFGEKEGDWKYYHPLSGKLVRQMHFSKGDLNGTVAEMDSNGSLVATCDYLNNEMHGTWKIYYPGSKQLMLQSSFVQGTLDGNLLTFHPSGRSKRIEEYQSGQLKSSTCFNPDGLEIPCPPFLQEPSYPLDEMAYMVNSIRYPAEAKKLRREGEVWVGFYVNTDGSISDTEVIKGIGAGCDDEAVRVIKSMRTWTPAMIDGMPFKKYVILPINFKL